MPGHPWPTLVRVALCAVITPLAPLSAQGADAPRGTIHVRVVNDAGVALPYADISIASERFSAFTDSVGALTIRHLPAGALTLRVRRIGFHATTVSVDVAPARATTIQVRLRPIAVQLASIRVTDDACGERSRGDTAVVAILEQLRMNAERYRLLADAYPFLVRMERTYGNRGTMSGFWSPRTGGRVFVRQVLLQDTVELAGRSEWRYAPGNLIVPVDERVDNLGRVFEKMMVPQLADFADSAFVAAHCFRYAGLDRIDSTLTVARIDFVPARNIRTADVRGSIYLDTATFQILKTRLRTERPAPSGGGGDSWGIQVDTWFVEFLPGLPIIDEIASMVTLSSTNPARRLRDGAATEYHQRLSVRFLDAFPGIVADPVAAPLTVAAGMDAVLQCEASGDRATLSSRDSPLDSATMQIEGVTLRVCYSRPMSTGNPWDSLAPLGREWRTGAHEPTTLRLNAELEVGGVVLPPGRYVMHTIPDSVEWRVIFYTATGTTPARMFASLQEVGRGTASVERLAAPVNPFTIRASTDAPEPALLLEWGTMRARIPVWTRR